MGWGRRGPDSATIHTGGIAAREEATNALENIADAARRCEKIQPRLSPDGALNVCDPAGRRARAALHQRRARSLVFPIRSAQCPAFPDCPRRMPAGRGASAILQSGLRAGWRWSAVCTRLSGSTPRGRRRISRRSTRARSLRGCRPATRCSCTLGSSSHLPLAVSGGCCPGRGLDSRRSSAGPQCAHPRAACQCVARDPRPRAARCRQVDPDRRRPGSGRARPARRPGSAGRYRRSQDTERRQQLDCSTPVHAGAVPRYGPAARIPS